MNNPSDDTTDLISKYPSNTPNRDSNSPSAGFKNVQTAYRPYDSAPIQEQHVSSRPHFHTPTNMSRTPSSSAVTLRDGDGSGSIDFSYLETPVSALPRDADNDPVSIKSPQYKDENNLNHKRKSRGGYESLGATDEHEYDGQDYVQHPMRVRTIKVALDV